MPPPTPPTPHPPKIIFILGPPGIGKGTQCVLLTQTPPKTHSIHHLSIGEILRTELAKPHSKWASIIRTNMAEGRTGPPEMTVSMLKSVMGGKMKSVEGGGGGEVVFLIDGFPRSMDRIALFESTISAPSLVLSLDCPLHILQERLLCRAESSSRVDDGVAIMQKRFEQHVCATKPVIAHYKERGLVVEIDGGRSVEAVQEDIRGALEKVLGL
ncbi:hypothetical protein OCU04_008876 [Sclerotinia nivalis]|uniref:Uridylate kinase n=1 Tax=Sclerotinia nivalis TaxID=352851 RepID=A0A9X0DIS6_9HELO|nr:hypothetical protein OCU04_008876 [Sclerotinia nivalis]